MAKGSRLNPVYGFEFLKRHFHGIFNVFHDLRIKASLGFFIFRVYSGKLGFQAVIRGCFRLFCAVFQGFLRCFCIFHTVFR